MVTSARMLTWQQPVRKPHRCVRLCCRFPIPYKLPPIRYGQGDVPWSVNKLHPGIDAFGVTLDATGEYVQGRVP